MRVRSSGTAWLLLLCVCSLAGCETPPREAPVSDLTGRRARSIAEQRLSQAPPAEPQPAGAIPARLIGPTDTQPVGTLEDINGQVPDPLDALSAIRSEREGEAPPPLVTPETWRATREAYAADVLERVSTIHRPRAVRLSMGEAVRRALKNSYAIQVQSYSPAIDATRIVEAEAQFDAVFFTNFSYNKQDRPSGSQLQGTLSDTRLFESGVRKLLSSGMIVQASYAMTRSYTNLQFQTLNPAYFNQFIVEFQQPLLKGFGIDYTRSQIENSRLEREKNLEVFRRTIRETIFNVEQAYWRLFQARRNVVVSARVLSSFETILDSFEKRLDFDVYPVQVNLIKSRSENLKRQFIRFRNDIKNAEDALKRLLNDPELGQAEDIEIVPSDQPAITPVIVDQLGELTAALNNRAELHEAKLTIQQAQIAIGVAKNQALPKLDLLFRYVVDGLGPNTDRAFKQMADHDFTEYVLQLQFEWPIGNRGPEAAIRRARLQQAQAIAAHRDAIEQVITEVNTAIRDLQTAYDQIGPSIRGARASQEQLRATILRGERRDPPTLEVELTAHETLAGQRQQLLQVLADYNIALINLERQKGTLLDYNNIVIRGANEEKFLEPLQPFGP